MAKNRSLRAVYFRLGRINAIIEQIIDENGHAHVLEVGCGFGLPMLELMGKFKDKLTIVGINKSAEHNLPLKALWEGTKQLRFSTWIWFINKKRLGFPKYVNCDASLRLPFEDNSFDFIYSMVATGFFSDKIKFLQETNRILKPGRIARIHFQHQAIEVNYSPNSEDHPSPPYNNLCEIRTKDQSVIEAEKYFERFPFLKTVKQGSGKPNYLELHKIESEMDLGLRLTESYVLTDINPRWVGYTRSIYYETNNTPG